MSSPLRTGTHKISNLLTDNFGYFRLQSSIKRKKRPIDAVNQPNTPVKVLLRSIIKIDTLSALQA